MSNLTRKKTTKDYEAKLANLAANTRENIQAAINNFKKFVHEKHQSTPDQICGELIGIKKSKGDEEYEKNFNRFRKSLDTFYLGKVEKLP